MSVRLSSGGLKLWLRRKSLYTTVQCMLNIKRKRKELPWWTEI